jgi:hypothetical protein
MNAMLDHQHNTIRQRKGGERREEREGRARRRAEQRRGEKSRTEGGGEVR